MPSIHNKAKKKRKLLRSQRGLCWLCGKSLSESEASFDHLIPKSKLGTARMENLKLSHKECNSARGNSMEPVFVEVDGVVALRWNVRSIGYI